MSERTLMTRAEVAAKLGYKLDWFYNNYSKLLDAGFPTPVFGQMNGARWDPRAIDLWLDRRIPDHLKADNLQPAQLDLIDAAFAAESAELDRRSAALVGAQ